MGNQCDFGMKIKVVKVDCENEIWRCQSETLGPGRFLDGFYSIGRSVDFQIDMLCNSEQTPV
jgi:hypothetical protein